MEYKSKSLSSGNSSAIANSTEEMLNRTYNASVQTDEDMVNHPHHYQSYNPELQIECIDAMRAAYGDEDVKSFCLCNAFKYLFRCYNKGRDEDVKKCQWYLDKFMELGGMDNE